MGGTEREQTQAWAPLVVVGTAATAVIDRGAAASLRDAVRAALEEAEPLVAFLSTLTANGVRDVPDFAYVGREDTAVRMLLRGAMTALASDEHGKETEFTAGSVSTWAEVVQADCTRVALRVGEEIVAVVSCRGADAPPNDRSSVAPGELRAPAPVVPAESSPVSTEETIVPPAEPELAELGSAAGPDLALATDDGTLAVSVSTAAPDDEVDLSHLFETRHVGVEAAAIRSEAVADDAPPSPPGGAPPLDLSHLPPPDSAPIAAPPPPGLIAGVPGSGAAVAEPPSPLGPPGDHDGLTISPSRLAALRGDSGLSGSSGPGLPNGAQLQAVSCPSGHLNPPQADSCRSCGTRIADRSIRLVSRPALGHLAFDSGRVVDIDRPLLIGRKPTVDGMPPDAEVPGLVVLPDPDGSLSRVHAEVRIEGWEVLVVDRHSTNGTRVEVPGQPPVMLRPMEPCLISPGTRITFADVASCAFQTGPR